MPYWQAVLVIFGIVMITIALFGAIFLVNWLSGAYDE